MTAAGIPALLEPIQERLDATTPGPWGRVDDLYHRFDQVHRIGSESTGSDIAFLIRRDQPQDKADAAFIAAAPTDTARLLAAVKAVVALHTQHTSRCGCDIPDGAGDCEECDQPWPCPTVSAVEAALRGTDV